MFFFSLCGSCLRENYLIPQVPGFFQKENSFDTQGLRSSLSKMLQFIFSVRVAITHCLLYQLIQLFPIKGNNEYSGVQINQKLLLCDSTWYKNQVIAGFSVPIAWQYKGCVYKELHWIMQKQPKDLHDKRNIKIQL